MSKATWIRAAVLIGAVGALEIACRSGAIPATMVSTKPCRPRKPMIRPIKIAVKAKSKPYALGSRMSLPAMAPTILDPTQFK